MSDRPYMNYEQPVKSGQIAFLRGIPREENPCDSRTSSNHRIWWDQGWLKQSQIKCQGIEIAPGEWSGCTQTNKDCPSCGK